MLREQAEDVIYNLNVLVNDDDNVPLEVIEKAIRNSAYWYHHPQGPVLAPNDAEHLEPGVTGWELSLGANTFLVEESIRRCARLIQAAAETVIETERPIDERVLRNSLTTAVSGAVANYRGEEYASCYNASDGFMHFGAHAIHVASFVSTIWDEAQTYLLAGETT